MKSIFRYSIEELSAYFIENEEKSYRATQIYEWIYKQKINDFKEIKNIKLETKEKLTQTFSLKRLKILEKLEGNNVKKYLFKLDDGNIIETVLMKQSYGNSLCVSTQIGCNMGCQFCASGKLKKIRNLEVEEMVLQILTIEADLQIRISHVVLMGIGEPFDNYDKVIKFINIINHPKGLAIGARHITVSTCGIIPKMESFIKDGKQINLAISLHAPNDKIRNKLMPINKVYNVEELLKTIKKYIKATNRRVTIEYIMLKGINDDIETAIELSNLLKGVNCYVNLIPYNETNNLKFKKSDWGTIMKFYDCLKKNKIEVTIRKELGTTVKAACGQLRANYKEGQ